MFLKELISKAQIPVQVIWNTEFSDLILKKLKISDSSTLGQVVKYTSGISINNGLLRILGGQNSDISPSIEKYNDLSDPEKSQFPNVLTVAYDAFGGVFAINIAKEFAKPGIIVYFAPDTLEWESLEIGHTAFVEWALTAELMDFYGDLLWDSFDEDVRKLNANQAFNFYPPLWTKEGKENKASKRIISLQETWQLMLEQARFLSDG